MSAAAHTPAFLDTLPFQYQALKVALIDGVGLSRDALHVYAGLIIYLLVRLGLRQHRATALSAALLVTLAAEWLDMRGEHIRGAFAPDAAHWHDVWNTMLWPCVLALIEPLWRRGSGQPAVASSDSSAD